MYKNPSVPLHLSSEKRNLNIDLIRVIACFLVVSVHFFANTDFYAQEIRGVQMFIFVFLRNFSMVCVPLFMILTGYLSRHFVFNKKLVLRFLHILLVYAISTIICKLYRTLFLGYRFSVKEIIYGLIDFSGAPYAWYVEMYLGMLLIIPFLNAGWKSLSRNGQRMTLLCFLFLSGIHTLIPSRSFFDYWSALYPIAYYFAGTYLAENPCAVKKRLLFPLLIAAASLPTLITCIRDYGAAFRAQPFTEYGSLYILLITVLLFQFILKLDLSTLPGILRLIIRHAAKATLPAYLVSYCFDCIVYEPFCLRIPFALNQLPFYFLLVPFIFMASLLLGYAVFLCTELLFKPVQALINRLPIGENS